MSRTDSNELGLHYTLARGVGLVMDFASYRLVVGEAQGRHVLVLEGKLLKVLDDLGQLGKNEIQGALLEDQVGVVGDWSCVRRRLPRRVQAEWDCGPGSCKTLKLRLTIAAGRLLSS